MEKITHFFAKIYTSVAFYLGWFCCVYSAMHDSNDVAVVATIILLAIQFKITFLPTRDIPLLIGVPLLGAFFDSSYMHLGLIEYAATLPKLPWLCPPWIICIYVLFASTINHSLSWLRHYPLTAAILGAAGGFLSYTAGEKVGAATFLAPGLVTPTVVGVVWFVLCPFFMLFSEPRKHQL